MAQSALKSEDEDVSMLIPTFRLPESAEPPDPDNPPKPLTWAVCTSISLMNQV